jgi:hypothetical protein
MVAALAARMTEAMSAPSRFVIDELRSIFGANAGIARALGEVRGPAGSQERRSYDAIMRGLQR